MNPLLNPLYYTENQHEHHFLSSLIAPAIGAAASLIGGSKQNSAAQANAASANAFTKEQLQNQHQWEVKDLYAAGLNPVLSAKFGGDIGSSAMAATPANLGAGVNSAISNARLTADIDLIKAQTSKTKSEKHGIDKVNKAKANIGQIADFVAPIIQDASSSATSVYNKAKSFTKGAISKTKSFFNRK